MGQLHGFFYYRSCSWMGDTMSMYKAKDRSVSFSGQRLTLDGYDFFKTVNGADACTKREADAKLGQITHTHNFEFRAEETNEVIGGKSTVVQKVHVSPTMLQGGMDRRYVRNEANGYVPGAAPALMPGDVCFGLNKDGVSALKLCANGDIFIQGRLATNDMEIVTGMRYMMLGIRDPDHARLADECGHLKTENTQLLAENARLRRKIR